MTITTTAGGTVVTGEDDIEFVRRRTLLHGLRLEVKTGMTMSRGRSCYALVKASFDLKGSKARVLEQYEKLMKEEAAKRGLDL